MLLLFLHGIAEAAPFSLWPLFTYERHEGRTSIEALGPLFFWERRGEEIQWGIRPLLSRYHKPGHDRWECLYPLGKYERRDGWGKAYLAPLWLTRWEEGGASNTALLTLFWGRTEKGEGYGGFFPFYGVFKERFRRDRTEFFLWPLYSRIEDEGTVTEKFLWPFFQLRKGEERGFCFWPFYCKRERPGDRKGYILWPFYVWRDKETNGELTTMRLYFPFYATIRSPRVESDIYLPPFFHHKRRLRPPSERWETPWPFVIWDQYEEGIFPIYRLRREPNKERRWILWPLFVYEWDRMGDQEVITRRFLLINRHRKTIGPKGAEGEDLNLWPLFSYRKGPQGTVDFYSLQLLPLHDEGLERNLYPLFWIIRYKRSPRGESIFDLLWGLFRVRKNPQETSWRFAFLFEGRAGQEFEELRLLGGLLCLREEKGRGEIRFFQFFKDH